MLDAVVVTLNGGRSASVYGVLSAHAAITGQLRLTTAQGVLELDDCKNTFLR